MTFLFHFLKIERKIAVTRNYKQKMRSYLKINYSLALSLSLFLPPLSLIFALSFDFLSALWEPGFES